MSSIFRREIHSKTLGLETGKLALQANGSVLIRLGDSMALATATMGKPRADRDFFPLTIDFEERLYARGKIPGSFFRREGRPSTDAILTDRLTDRPLRPLFPKGFQNEVQLIITALSSDQENPLDIPAIIGASAALGVSDIPFAGPVGATRIGYVGGAFVVNPTYQQLEESQLELVVAGTRAGVLMIEAGGYEVSEELVLEAIQRGQEVNQEVIALQEEMVRSVGKPKVSFDYKGYPENLDSLVHDIVDGRLGDGLDATAVKAEVVEKLQESYEPLHIEQAYDALVEKDFRERALQQGQRPDGRGLKEIREISCEVGVLPRTHGSALFARGETQVLGVVTLGSVGDAQRLDNLAPRESKRFMLHYNFPPYSTGETRMIGSPRRRDIGHGALAERALLPVLPSDDKFPYTIRLVAEVLGSNGSTSMGSTCACCLALMDAGVPISAPVAGISVGLIVGEDGRFATLTDIQGMEDHLGDMDFKVAGTAKGITAIQLDIKVKNIDYDIIRAALAQAREARLEVLESMREAIDLPRADMSPYAPRMVSITVPVDKIGAIIGPGGKTIRGIVEETKATIDVQDDGTVIIGSTDGDAARRAIEIIEGLTKEAKVGEIYTGKVVRIMNFGAFVEILPGTDGMVHISELANYRVPNVEDVVNLGDEITVVIKDIDASGRISLSRRALLQGSQETETGDSSSGDTQGDDSPVLESGRYGTSSGGPRQGDGRPGGEGRPGAPRQGQGNQGYRREEQRGSPRSGPRHSGPGPRR